MCHIVVIADLFILDLIIAVVKFETYFRDAVVLGHYLNSMIDETVAHGGWEAV